MTIPNYIPVFEQRLDKLKSLLKQQLELPKNQRDTQHLKKILKQARELSKTIKHVKKKHVVTCPHCGGEL